MKIKKATLISGITALGLSIISITASFIFASVAETEYLLNIPLKLLIVIVSLAVGIAIFTTGSLLGELNSVKSRKAELEQEVNALTKKTAALEIGNESAGQRFFDMALSQKMCSPLQMELLKHAANEHNVYAALTLASLYTTEPELNGSTASAKEYDMAAEVYKSISEFDTTGVSDWMLGWFYENNYTSEAQALEKEQRLELAKDCYIISKAKGYPKAINSIGKFYYYGWGGYELSEVKAIHHYEEAADLDDVFGCMNCGHAEMERYKVKGRPENLRQAREYFTKAAQYNNTEGWVQLGNVCIECGDYTNAKECYLKSLNGGINPYVATGYYQLGCLINNSKISDKDSEIRLALGCSQNADYAIECFKKSYEIYQASLINGIGINGFYRTCYEKLVAAFETIK